jgi:hypothetical protein
VALRRHGACEAPEESRRQAVRHLEAAVALEPANLEYRAALAQRSAHLHEPEPPARGDAAPGVPPGSGATGH